VLLFIVLKDLPELSASTYHILLANVTASNLFVCTFIKSVGSIYISYAFARGVDSVAFEFCTFYEASHWLTLPILPWSLLILSWQVFLGSRRAERRSLNVPKETLSIFLMMIPLARAVTDPENAHQALVSPETRSKVFARREMKRKEIKAQTMREGPRPAQAVMLGTLWVAAALLAMERVVSLESRVGAVDPVVRARRYWVQPYANSTKMLEIIRELHPTYCNFWTPQVGRLELVIWVLMVPLPLAIGPLAAGLLDFCYWVKKSCEKASGPPTPSRAKYWMVVLALSLLSGLFLSLHLVGAELLRESSKWSRLTCLLVKHFLGRHDLILFPLVVLCFDPTLRAGLKVMFLRKRGGQPSSSLQSSACTSTTTAL